MSRIKFLNTEVDNLTMNEAVQKIEQLILNKKPSYVVTPNVDHIVKLETDKEFQKVYKEADLILIDGMPLIWISKLKKNPIKEKVSGSDLFPEVCKLSANKGYKVFLLGAAEGVAAMAAENLKKRYNGLNVVGTYSPSYGFEKKKDCGIRYFANIQAFSSVEEGAFFVFSFGGFSSFFSRGFRFLKIV